jgi:hypothetical protein
LTFNGFYYRTTRINEAVRLIYMMDKRLDENKNGQPEENFKSSISVARTGRFSNHFLADLRLISELSA